MIKKALTFYHDLNLRHKLFFTYLALIVIPFLVFILINNFALSKDQKAQAQYSSRQVFEQSRSYVEYKVDSIKTYLNVLSMNEKIQSIIKKDASAYAEDDGLYGFDITEIKKQIFNANPNEDIVETQLYMNGSIASVDETYNVKRISSIESDAWYKRMLATFSIFEWFPSTDVPVSNPMDPKIRYISVARKIQNSNSMSETIGLVRADMPESAFTTLLDRAAFFKSSSVFLVGDTGSILCASSEAHAEQSADIAALIENYPHAALKDGVWRNLPFEGKTHLIGLQSVKGTPWTMIIATPYKEILASQSKTLRQMLLIFVLVLPIIFPLSLWGAASSTKRIRNLIDTMRSVQTGDFNTQILPSGRDEIGELTRNFNTMITKIAILMDEKYTLGQEIKSIELKALQAQINPHFLYNTLDLIYWKAMRIKEPSIFELVQSLSKFYKLSLGKGEDVVPLRNEMEHVNAFIRIQNARFANRITFRMDISEALQDQRIPKITLQPLVENSIIHGILETPDETGTITITGRREDNRFLLEISDDGVGMSETKLSEIMLEHTTNSPHGYGIHNIDRRIKLLYGEAFGLSFESREGAGTLARVTLPFFIEAPRM